jgi:hypothetical protein
MNIILVLRVLQLEFYVKLWLSGICFQNLPLYMFTLKMTTVMCAKYSTFDAPYTQKPNYTLNECSCRRKLLPWFLLHK